MVPFSPFPFMFLFVFVFCHATVWMGSNKLNWTELNSRNCQNFQSWICHWLSLPDTSRLIAFQRWLHCRWWGETNDCLAAVTLGFQVHQFQPNDDTTVIDAQQVRQGPGRLRRHVLHLLLGFRSARVPALRHPVRGVPKLLHVNVRISTIGHFLCYL